MRSRNMPARPGLLALVACVLFSLPAACPRAATLTWDAGNTANGATIDPASGTWDLAGPVWNDAGNNVAWTQTNATTGTNAAVFDGPDGAYTVTVGAAIGTQNITFNASGFTLSAAAAQTVSVNSGQFVTVVGGKTATVGANVTLAGVGGGSLFLVRPNVSPLAGGTLNIDSGGTVQAGGTLAVVGPGAIVNVNTGGTLRNTAAGTISVAQPKTDGAGATLNLNGGTITQAGGTLLVANALNSGGNAGSAVGVFNMTGGTVTQTGGGSLTLAGGSTNATFTSNGTVHQSGGTITTGTGGVILGLSADATATYNFNGGTLVTNRVIETGGTSTFNWNGGTIRAAANNATFMQGLDAVNVNAGGAILDTNNFNVTVGQSLAGVGGLTKNGGGALTLTGANTYTGPTAVNAGALVVDGTLDPATTVTLAAGATLGGAGTVNSPVTVPGGARLSPATATTAGTLNIAALTLNAGALLDLEFGGGGSDLVNVLNADALTLNGGAFNLYGTGGIAPLAAPGSYTLIDYNGTFAGSVANLSVANPVAGKQYTFANDAGNTAITLTIVDLQSEWTGLAGDGLWTTAGNWTAGPANTAGLNALFGTTPGSPSTVQVNGPKTVGAITFDNGNGYTIAGGAADVITLDSATTGAAGLNVNSGAHTLAAPLALVSDLLVTTAGGTSLTVSGNITGAAKNLSVIGSGTLTLTGTNVYAATAVSGSGASLRVGDGGTTGNLGTGPVTLGAETNLVFNRSDTLTVAGNISGASATVFQEGTGTTVLAGTNTFGTTAGGLTINAGTARLGAANALPAGVILTANNGTLDLNGNNATAGPLSGGGGVITDGSAAPGTTTLTLAGNTVVTFGGSITDGAAGRVVALVRDTGAVTPTANATLSGNNTYTGGTTFVRGFVIADTSTALGTGDITFSSPGTTGATSTRLLLGNGVNLANKIVFTTAANGNATGVLGVSADGVDATFSGPITIINNAISGGHVSGPTNFGMLNITGPVTGTGIFQQRSGRVTYSGGGNYTNMNLTGNAFLGANNGLSTAAVVNIGPSAAAVLDLNGFNQTLAGLTKGPSAATVTNNGGAPATLTLDTPADVNYAGTIVDGSQPILLAKAGAAVHTLSAVNTYTGATTVNAGTLQVTGSIANSSVVAVNTGGTFDAAASQSINALNVATGGVAKVTSATATRTVLRVGDNVNATPLTAAGKVDLVTNALAVQVPDGSEAAALAQVRAAIVSGYNATPAGAGNGDWAGNGITSSTAAANASASGVGYALASEVAPGGDFLGASVDPSTVVARYTLLGDATLDGLVDFNDLVKLAQNYNVTDGSRLWFTGDFTYDGDVDFNDLVKLAQNYNTALPTEPIPGAPADFGADLAAAFAAVPEPSLGTFGALTLATLFARRRPRA